MKRSHIRILALCIVLAGIGAYRFYEHGPLDVSSLGQNAQGTRLRITILGDPKDPRVAPAREAIAYWNREFARLARKVRFDSAIVRNDSVPDAILRSASSEVLLGRGPATSQLQAKLSDVPADVVIALSHTDLISFSVRWRPDSRGVAGIRRSDVPPLSMPNTVRNVIAHEIGHVLGLDHNTDSTMLMCGRPSTCRPAAFASETTRFFPLTPADEHRLQERWP